ncbi:hypothetical protein Cci01nite_70540 [Catellatospora citrea]|uniref:Restriction endonuclease n=1 Tax=Catellatospora citrea TaxID=53366 RepID=A0A8J3P570_9ACTN|nr:hypothetical protein C8E86_2651 [Catellatospora citrea]GIG01961.1 hypothetical protein Cci01nite_70540 [Catellatospora citrea]
MRRIAVDVDGYDEADRYGTDGQNQGGIDIVASRAVGGGQVAYQCKRVEKFTPTDLREAVEKFAVSQPLGITELIIVASCVADDTHLFQDLQKLRVRFPELTIRTRYGRRISDDLRSHYAIVEEFWGRPTAEVFCTGTVTAGPANSDMHTGSRTQISIAGGDARVFQIGGSVFGGTFNGD